MAENKTIVDETTGEVITTTTKEEAPKLLTNEQGTYQGIFLAPPNMEERISNALNAMVANGDTELAEALANGKKTIKGCVRFIDNNMADLARAMKANKVTFDDDTVHMIARYYMCNPDALDVQNVVEKATSKPKAEKKPKPEKKEEKKTKVVPLTPQMGNLFGDDDF